MTVLLAIDPGYRQSAWLVFDTETEDLGEFGVSTNEELLELCRPLGRGLWPVSIVVIEKVEGFGMAVGAEVFETVWWSGRFAQAAAPLAHDRIGRKAIKLHLCGSARAKDPNVRQALIDRFGGPEAIGRKATPGPLYGISKDVWSALAVAVTWADLHDPT